MPFLKLDCRILASSLWVDVPARNVFLTALILAEPHELESPTDEIEIRSLKTTGWRVPVGWYGLAEVAGPRLVDMSGMPYEEGIKALERLRSPDPESRSDDFDGRRMVRVDGGYLILNYIRYRDKSYAGLVRQQNFRHRQRSAKLQTVTHQEGRCDCCGAQFQQPYSKFVVQDHKHCNPPKNRGIVCQSCNRVIGMMERGQPYYGSKVEIVKSYLEKWEKALRVTPVYAYASSSDSSSLVLSSSCEPPAGFPRSADDAVAMCTTIGCPPDFIRSTWNLAYGRGGRDSKDVPIRSFVHHVASSWAFSQNRPVNGTPKPQVEDIGTKNMRALKREIDAIKLPKLS
jgi:Recombination endonuclease VII